MSKFKAGWPASVKAAAICGVMAGKIDFHTAAAAKRDGADALELRADTFKDVEPTRLLAQIKRLRKLKLPLLLTVRSEKEGGRPMSDAARLRLFRALVPAIDAIDIELGSTAILKEVLSLAKKHGKGKIVSHHDFKRTPAEARLKSIVKKARAAGADVVKIAALVKTEKDLKRLAGLLLASSGLVVIGMGERGRASRVLFPALGSLVTYGSTTKSSAPGQMSVKELCRAFDVIKMGS